MLEAKQVYKDTLHLYWNGELVGELIGADCGKGLEVSLDIKPSNHNAPYVLGWKRGEDGYLSGRDDLDRDGKYSTVTVALPKEG